MKIAIATSEGRVSPVFEVGSELLIVDLRDGRETHRETHVVRGYPPGRRIRWLTEASVDVLICGGILSSHVEMLRASGVGVVDRARGTVDEALRLYRASAV